MICGHGMTECRCLNNSCDKNFQIDDIAEMDAGATSEGYKNVEWGGEDGILKGGHRQNHGTQKRYGAGSEGGSWSEEKKTIDTGRDTMRIAYNDVNKRAREEGIDFNLIDELNENVEGIRKLNVACLRFAIYDLERYNKERDLPDSQCAINYFTAREWVLEKEDNGVFSFESCCEVLGVHPDNLRASLQGYFSKK